MKQITIGTRASKLAMIQTRSISERLLQLWPDLEIAIAQIHTRGDRLVDAPLNQIGGDGVFVTEIERALAEKRIDLAVHSLKDLPTVQPDGLQVLAIGPREDVRDVFVANRAFLHSYSDPQAAWSECEAGLRIGTGSARRMAQLRTYYPDALFLPLRGNVDTRLRKLESGEYDVIVLAAAGLHRLDMQERLAGCVSYLPVERMLPAPGQGALAVEIRAEPEIRSLIAPLEDAAVQAATTAERLFMRRLGAGCYLPVAAYGGVAGDQLTLRGLVSSLDGQRQVHVSQSIAWVPEAGARLAEQLGIMLAEQALARGAGEIIRELNAERVQERQHV